MRERRKNDSDDPKPTTRSHKSPSSPSQSPYYRYHPAFTDPDPSDDCTSVSSQTDDVLGGDEREYERDIFATADRGTVVEKGKYRGDGLSMGDRGSFDRGEYGENFSQSLERDDREDYNRNFATMERGTVERRRYGRDSSTAREQGTFNKGKYDRDSLRSVGRSVEERKHSYRDFDEREYDGDILMSTNQDTGSDFLITVDRDIDDLAIPDSDQGILLPSEVEKLRSQLLRDRIRKCRDVEEVFALHRKHHVIMGVHHILLVLEMLSGFVSDRWVSFIEPFSLSTFSLLHSSLGTLRVMLSGKTYPYTHTNSLQSYLQVLIGQIQKFLY